MHRRFGERECGYSRALVSRPSAERRSRTEREPGPSATTREAQYGCRLRSVVSPPRSTQVGFTRLASSNCRSRASPRSVSRYDRPGHERPAAREANRWPQSRLTMSNSAVFLVPATRSGVRVCLSSSHPPFASASVGEPAVIWRHQQSHFTPTEGWMERRQGTLFVLSRVRGATSEPCGAACPVANGTSLGAPPWRFSAGDRRRRLRE